MEIYLACYWMSRSAVMHWVWHVALIERGPVAAVSVSPTICDHLHFTDEGLKAPVCALHLLSYPSLKLGVRPSGPSWEREREREFECPTCRDIRLNVSQAAEITYNVGIMPHNIGTLDGGQDLRRKKELGQRTEAGREVGGQWRKKKGRRTGFITLLVFGPVHVDWLTVLGHTHVLLSLPFLSLLFSVPEQVSHKTVRCRQVRHLYV